ncbi:MAG TPA: transporter substrate-binding domain-containing protein [Burkholderiaceae bacterium]
MSKAKYLKISLLYLAICQFATCGETIAQTRTPLTLYYYERKPFHYTTDDGKVAGLTVVPTEAAFAKLDIPIHWSKVPVNRILAQIKMNREAACSPGSYKKPDREKYARYSIPIYRDKPLVGLANARFLAEPGITARELLARPDTRLLVKQNFSQGAYMDELIAKMPSAHVFPTTDEVPTMVQMIARGRADLIITTQEEVEIYIHQSGFKLEDFHILVFPDVPEVEKRYILCSQEVPVEVIDNLNSVLTKIVH